MSKILLVEDEKDIRELIQIQLESIGHQVVTAATGPEAIKKFDADHFDLFILDRLLPELTGIEICKYICQSTKTPKGPILMVTALVSPENIVEGLDSGADDYITKPFDLKVLLARVRSLLRRGKEHLEKKNEPLIELSYGDIKINFEQIKVWVQGQEIKLTKSEFKLLEVLLKNARKVLGRDQLVSYVQDGEVFVTNRTIDTHIFSLRNPQFFRQYQCSYRDLRQESH